MGRTSVTTASYINISAHRFGLELIRKAVLLRLNPTSISKNEPLGIILRGNLCTTGPKWNFLYMQEWYFSLESAVFNLLQTVLRLSSFNSFLWKDPTGLNSSITSLYSFPLLPDSQPSLAPAPWVCTSK